MSLDYFKLGAGPGAGIGDRWRAKARSWFFRGFRNTIDSAEATTEPQPLARTFQSDAEERAQYWDGVFNRVDPWTYGSPYEQVKYERTLALLEGLRIGQALELACAEGHFTEKLGLAVRSLKATDISEQAVTRARERCAKLCNVDFATLDFMAEDIGEGWELIVCSEVLYYTGGKDRLGHVCQKMASALKPGGYILTANAYVLADDPHRTGFRWGDYGAQTINDTFTATPGLALAKSIETELYRIDLFQRKAPGADNMRPTVQRLSTGPLPEAAPRQALVRWGALTARSEARAAESTGRIPILMYHRIANGGPEALSRWRVSPAEFERQIRFLARRGYGSITIEDWERARQSGEWIAGRPVMLTFDDGYDDFFEQAWPILEHYEFTAHVFLVTGCVGGRANWDKAMGSPAPLMDWSRIQALARAGCGFGSHLESHTRVDRLSRNALMGEARRSKAAIDKALGRDIDSVCLPHDYTDAEAVRALRESGYRSVFGVRPGIASIHEPADDVPRLEIRDSTSLKDLAAMLGRSDQPAEPRDHDLQIAR